MTVVLVGASGLLIWLLLRAHGAGRSAGSGGPSAATPSPSVARCRVVIRAQQIDVDGTPAALADVVARCRETGRADVLATGDAIVRSIGVVVHALQAAGIDVRARDSVWAAAALPRPTEGAS